MKVEDLVEEGSIAARRRDGVVVSLGTEVESPAELLEHVPASVGEGREVYRRGLILALDLAARRAFPDRRLWVEHSLSLGYRCRLEERPPLPAEEVVATLSRCLSEVVEEAIPFRWLTVGDSVEAPQACAGLARWRRGRRPLRLNVLEDGCAFAMGPAVPDTSWLERWELRPMGRDFVLRFPGSACWPDISPWEPRPKLAREFDLEERHGARMGVRTVDELNSRIREDQGRSVVVMSHFYQTYRLVQIVRALQDRFPQKRLITIAGPSSSGKTTVARLLTTYLRAKGFGAKSVSVDNYFRNRDETPLGPDGRPDFECLEALETELFGRHLGSLLEGEEVALPRFDFHSGRRTDGVTPLRLAETDFLIIEGIHGLNDMMTPGVDPARKFRIYVSALTQLNIDRLTRMSTSDSRLLRRIVRDSACRGYSAAETIRNWPMVRRGERMNIFPFQEQADAMFNSALPYELPVLRNYAVPLLEQVEPGSRAYHTADRLLRLLDLVLPIDAELVPKLSLLREFIGGSLLDPRERTET
jgi:uridine kinase